MKKILIGLFIFFGILNNVNANLNLDNLDTTIINSLSLSENQIGYGWDSKFLENGTVLIVTDIYDGSITNTSIKKYNLSIPYDLSSAVFEGGYIDETSYGPVGVDVSDNGLFLTTCNSGNPMICKSYLFGTAFDFSTISTIGSFTAEGRTNKGLQYNNDGTKIFIADGVNNIIYQYTLNNPYDVTSAVLDGNIALSTNIRSFKFINNGSQLLFVSSQDLLLYNLGTSYDLQSKTLINQISLNNLGNPYSFLINNDGTKLYGVQSYIKSYNTNVINNIDIVANGTIQTLENGIKLSGVNINKDFYINYVITKYDINNIGSDVDNGTKGNFIGGLNDIQFLNNNNFQFESLGLYDLDITFININDPTDTIRKVYNADYNYNGGYIDPGTINYSFNVNGFTFFENGFTLNNFVPNPSGGKLYFDIIAPNTDGTGTINLQTNYFLPYAIDGNGYGIDSSVKVTYPYHQVAGIYQVRTVYDYDGNIIYPFGTEYNSYEITVAELPANYSPDFIYVCDINNDGTTDIGESIACPITILKYYSHKITDNVNRLEDFFRSIMNIGTNEIKTFSFIPSVHANFLNNMPSIQSQNNVFSKLYYFIKGFLYLIFLVFTILLIIYLKKE